MYIRLAYTKEVISTLVRIIEISKTFNHRVKGIDINKKPIQLILYPNLSDRTEKEKTFY